MKKHVPKHLAIIPDGNRRWAKKKGYTTHRGYTTGIEHIGEVLKWCKANDIHMLSMWGFSTDNFNRDSNEIGRLFSLFKQNLKKALESDEKNKHDLRVRFFGRIHLFPKEIQKMIKKAEEISSKNSEYQLNLLLAYGGREELVDAVNKIIKSGAKKIDEQALSDSLYTSGVPDPDLIIRTSGEQRLSGLMPWQSCYSEFYFSKKLWPEFGRKDFDAALKEYAKRRRRYGR